jgi:trehalose 6-phosphate synthase
MSLVVCSNSPPAFPEHSADQLRPAAPGGLVPHLVSLLTDLDESGGQWIFPVESEQHQQWPDELSGIRLHPVTLERDVRHLHYRAVSIETLLWLFHYLHDTVTSPCTDTRWWCAWETYEQVNRRVADRMAAACRDDPDSTIVVNDYPFMLVPGLIRQRAGDRRAPLVYAHQVPWCEPDYFGLLPGTVRERLLRGLLASDVVVFHSPRWRDAFLGCCLRYLSDVSGDGERVKHSGGVTRLRCVPFPLDAANVRHLADGDVGRRWAHDLTAQAQGRRMVVRVDRLDLWKNHIRGFLAFEQLLARDPRLADELWFLTVLSPVRYPTERHRQYEHACRSIVERINATYSRGDREVVTLLYPRDPAESRPRGLAALQLADAVLVNPTFDGFNLVAKEALLLAGKSDVLLSPNTGAYPYVAPAVRTIDPFDVDDMTDALHASLVESRRDDPVRDRMRALISADSSAAWLRAACGDLF